MTVDEAPTAPLAADNQDLANAPNATTRAQYLVPREPRDGFTAVGRVLRPHGIRGELRVAAFAPGAPNLQQGRLVYLQGTRLRVLRSRPDRDAWILQLEGITGRDAAEQARDSLIEAADADVARNDEDSFFIHELVGLRVLTTDGEDLGNLTEVLQAGGADVYVASGPRGEVLFPAIADVVKEINVREQFMRITPLPGLLDKTK